MTPQLAPDVELLGPYRDSGLQNPPYLVRRGGRILQVSRLLHTVAAGADGSRTFDEMAAVASVELDRSLSGDEVRVLVQKKLAPAGILTIDGAALAMDPTDRAAAQVPAPDTRLLALRFRRAVASPEVMGSWARWFTPLFRPPVVAAVVVGALALDLWVFGILGVGGALGEVARTPALMLFMVTSVCLSGIFHEFGHATGCVASGGRPGAAGIGFYLCWPVLYTNVTDTYRLDRRGRLRTDLGGVYFNAVLIVMLGSVYLVSGWEPLLALIVIEHVLVLEQLTPWLRLDGYYVVSDLTGVPDIFSKVRPALLSLRRGQPTHPDILRLRPYARRILYGYLVSLVVFVVVVVVPGVVLLPRVIALSAGATGPHLSLMGAAAGRWDTPMVIIEALQVALLALPIVGLALTFGSLAARAARAAVHRPRSRPRPVRTRAVRRWLDASGLTVVLGNQFPGGGAVDYFAFGPGGEVLLVGVAGRGRTPRHIAGRLCAAAAELSSLTAEKLDRLLLDATPARRDFQLLVARPKRFSPTLRVYPVAICAKRNETEK